MSKHEPGNTAIRKSLTPVVSPLPAAAAAKPTRRTRQIITLEALNSTAAPATGFDDLDFAALDEPREPEKWY